jgi:hypothetical protein
MTSGGRYYRNAEAFKEDAFAVLRSKFHNRQAFEHFYESIPDPDGKNEFLRVCCSYRYLAKHGKWKVFVRGVNKDIAYLDTSFKLVTVFSLIESLYKARHEDFFDWLVARDPSGTFPIQDKAELVSRYREYKETFGSVRRCVVFFCKLPLAQKEALCKTISTKGKPVENIKKLAEFLYTLRSNFVHEGEFAHEVCGGYINTKKGLVRSSLIADAVFDAFENGVLAHFSP